MSKYDMVQYHQAERKTFFVPPVGVIDGSVLTTVDLLLMFSVIAKIPEVIKDGKIVKIRKGDFTAEVDAEPNE